MVAEAARAYGAEDKYFLTGWEAGGHTVWAALLQHPEALRAAALSTPNYQGRWPMAEEVLDFFATFVARH